ncbi:PAAR-like domain-containing protein [Providencia rettgeri]|nr:PAAR-like domain-containing protein [Providencia rettgeri]
MISLTPDVCKTLMGSSTSPIPYPVIAKLESTVSVVPSVKANGHPVILCQNNVLQAGTILWSKKFV